MAGHVPVGDDLDASIAEALKANKFQWWEKRQGIKVPRTATKIAVCIPMGDKDNPDVHECKKCGTRDIKNPTLRAAGLVPIEFVMNAFQLVTPLLVSLSYYVRKSVPSARAREEMTNEAIKNGADYIFYWDDDTLIHPATLLDMHNLMERHRQVGIISGVYTTRQECTEPILYKRPGDGSYWDFSTEKGILEPGFASGAGCMMARVKALKDVERLKKRPWWDDEWEEGRNEAGDYSMHMYGHDIRFCRNMALTGEQYAPEHDIGYMTKSEAMDLAREEMKDIEDENLPALTVRANEIMDGARQKREDTLIEKGSAVEPWQFTMAGWLTCYHFDVMQQKFYHLPHDAPCFKNSNTRGYWDHQARQEGEWSELSGRQRGSEAWLHPKVAELVPAGSHVIDLGCYAGALGDRLIKTCGCTYFGYDISEVAIEQLKRRHMNGAVADLRALSIDDDFNGKDVVTCLETMEHLDDERLQNTVKQIAKFTRAIVSVPDGNLPTPGAEHVREFTAESLAELLKGHFPHVSVEKVEPHFLLAVCSKEAPDGASSGSVVVPERDEPLHQHGS